MSTKRKMSDYFTKRSKTIDEPQLIPNKVQITSEKISENQDQVNNIFFIFKILPIGKSGL